MRTFFGLLLAACCFVAVSAQAGTLNFENNQTSWRSTQCVKPNAPASFLAAHSETAGDDMNSLVAQHNAYVDAAQAYMNCISTEAERDQNMVNQAITSGAQKAISNMQSDVNAAAATTRDSHK